MVLVVRGGAPSILRRCRLRTRQVSAATAAGIHGPAMPPDEDVYDPVARYPEIERFRNRNEKCEAQVVDKIKKMGTVEEKQYFVNLPKFFGWHTFHMVSSDLPPAALNSAQYYTNTTLVHATKLPENEKSQKDEELAKKIAEEMIPSLKEVINFHLKEIERLTDVVQDKIKFREAHAVLLSEKKALRFNHGTLVNGISRLLMAKLMCGHAHLRGAVLDGNPRNEAFWFRGHIDNELAHVEKMRKRVEGEYNKTRTNPMTMEEAERQADRTFQFLGDDTHLQIRTSKTLTPFLGFSDDPVVSGHVPRCDHNPKHVWHKKKRHGTNLLATWTGTGTPFSHLALVSNVNGYDREISETAWKSGSEFNDYQDMIATKCLLNGFGICYAAACNQGFTPFTDPTTPFVSQVAVTDGRKWKLSCFQLNKTAMQGVSESNEEMRRNVCWHADEEELFTDVEGEVADVNVDLLKDIIKMYVKEPTVSQEDIPNEEHLDGKKRHLYQIKNEYNRESMHENHRNMYANKPLKGKMSLYGEVLAYQRLWHMEVPEVMHAFGAREKNWYIMSRYAPEGREFWHPEFRWYDNVPGKPLAAKYRGPRGKYRTPYRQPVVTAPLPPDDD